MDDERDDDPFRGLPPELRAMLEQFGGGVPGGLGAMFGGLAARPTATGNVDWDLAERVALEQAASGDRAATPDESARIDRALALAEHWLDTTGLPAASDAGRLVVASRQDWTRAALQALRPLVEPVAGASVRALSELAREQLRDIDADDLSHLGIELPAGVESILRGLFDADVDLGEMLRPAAAMLTGLQVGQVVGALSRQMLGQYDLGVPTAPRTHAHLLPVNIEDAFGEWDLDPTDVAVVLAVDEAALRRLYHAVEWLEGHLHGLIGEFAAGTRVDRDRLDALSHELMTGVDPDDPDALRAAMEHAATFRLEPTDAQRRVLARLQAVIALTTAWARREARNALGDRIPSRARIDEVLRRRRATRGDGEALLANLLGLDLRPADESVADAFVATVTEVLGSEGLHRALAHPENLPDTDELADPLSWLSRTAPDSDVPDDLATLFAGLGDAPVEASADQRAAGEGRVIPLEGPPTAPSPESEDAPGGGSDERPSTGPKDGPEDRSDSGSGSGADEDPPDRPRDPDDPTS